MTNDRKLRVVIAPDSFKFSASATDAAAHLAEGWASVRPMDHVKQLPMADGGEGTVDAIFHAVEGAELRTARVTGPAGEPVDANWALLPDGTAVIELAQSSGIELLDELIPLDATTTGCGEVIRAALRAGATRIAVGLGSSASTDAGLGILRALGAKATDVNGADVPDGARGVLAAHSIDLPELVPLPPGGVVALTDVDAPLFGQRGAAVVFGPQKGLGGSELSDVDEALARFAGLTNTDPYAPGMGAAGGTGFGLAVWGASVVTGAAEVARVIGLEKAIAEADVVITGEGAFDGQSAFGKVPFFVAELARSNDVEVNLVAGVVKDDADTSQFARVEALRDRATTTDDSIVNALTYLREAGRDLARGRS